MKRHELELSVPTLVWSLTKSQASFNGAIWHGQREVWIDFRNRLRAADRSRMSALARYLLALDDETQ